MNKFSGTTDSSEYNESSTVRSLDSNTKDEFFVTTPNDDHISTTNLANLSHLSKKESGFRNWFNFSHNTSSLALESENTSNSSSIAAHRSSSETTNDLQYLDKPKTGKATTQNSKKQNLLDIRAKATNSSNTESGVIPTVVQHGEYAENSFTFTKHAKEQQKSTRRTTSFLNLFMPSSQGNFYCSLLQCPHLFLFGFSPKTGF